MLAKDSSLRGSPGRRPGFPLVLYYSVLHFHNVLAAVHIFFLVDVFILLGENATRLFLYVTTWDLLGAFFFGLADIIYRSFC